MKRTSKWNQVVIVASFLSLAGGSLGAEPRPFIRKGMESALANDGMIELPVAESKRAAVQRRLNTLLETYKPAKLDLAIHSPLIASALAEKCLGSGFQLQIRAVGPAEGGGCRRMVFTFTEDGWLDDATQGQRYQYVVDAKDGKWVLSGARAWFKPNPRRFESQQDYYKTNKTQWGER